LHLPYDGRLEHAQADGAVKVVDGIGAGAPASRKDKC
jgi:hypothetical protein